ncbi:thrombospondin-related anonymous protein, putative sporozoite surface protein 2, putative [Plasmodium vinckei brucechwatti]|uniref:Thrombospondin-related anonymous protein, putative sporozoite surface protein 2, putative n=1 Tax=Plasmodium vinckei brucechwatti TaxID=119398 RepID=A0A6V7STH3_PLAVN|nr:thrombospondin-related anonymous protein, putative sporozoite surface protein 2, putative [Plasmodium vinckei brucechwatti]
MKLLGNSKYLFVVLLLCISVFLRGQEIPDEIKYSEEVCNEKIDIHILVDGSGSIGQSNWVNYLIPTLATLVDSLNISKDAINLTMTLFSTNPQDLIRMNGYGSTDKNATRFVIEYIQTRYSPHGTTNLTAALMNVDNLVQNKSVRPDAIQLVIILTDGIPNNLKKAAETVDELKKKDVKVAIIGVGSGVNHKYNRILVGCARLGRCPYYSSGSWNKAQEMIKPFLSKVCQEVERTALCGKWEEWSECSTTCGNGTKTRRRKILHPDCIGEMTSPCNIRDCPPKPVVPPVIHIKVPEIPVEPVEPIEPAEPIEPENPILPIEPIIPADPANPVEPLRPEKIEEPFIVPDEPIEPIVIPNIAPEEPIEPIVIPGIIPEEPRDPLVIPNIAPDEPIEPIVIPDIIPEKPIEAIVAPNVDPNIPIIPEENNEIPRNLPENPDKPQVEYPKPNEGGNNPNIPNQDIIPGDNDPYRGQRERIPKPHQSNDGYVYDDYINDNEPLKPETINNNEENKNKNKSKSNNGYKIAGGIIGGLAIIGCAGVAYNFIASSGAAGLAGEPAPFEDVIPDDQKETIENEQFKLPEDNDWN